MCIYSENQCLDNWFVSPCGLYGTAPEAVRALVIFREWIVLSDYQAVKWPLHHPNHKTYMIPLFVRQRRFQSPKYISASL